MGAAEQQQQPLDWTDMSDDAAHHDEPEWLRTLRADGRYAIQAYLFLHEALQATTVMLGMDRMTQAELESRHVSGQQLLEGIRRHALHRFGFLAHTVFEHWGVKRTEDWGAIVFKLVETDMLRKQESDTEEDFADGYDFAQAFEQAYFRDRLYLETPEIFTATSTVELPEPPARPGRDEEESSGPILEITSHEDSNEHGLSLDDDDDSGPDVSWLLKEPDWLVGGLPDDDESAEDADSDEDSLDDSGDSRDD